LVAAIVIPLFIEGEVAIRRLARLLQVPIWYMRCFLSCISTRLMGRIK
jgi:predicted HTH domain antitoxin